MICKSYIRGMIATVTDHLKLPQASGIEQILKTFIGKKKTMYKCSDM